MKKLLLIILAVTVLLAGCAQSAVEPENTLEPTVEATEEAALSPTLSEDPISSVEPTETWEEYITKQLEESCNIESLSITDDKTTYDIRISEVSDWEKAIFSCGVICLTLSTPELVIGEPPVTLLFFFPDISIMASKVEEVNATSIYPLGIISTLVIDTNTEDATTKQALYDQSFSLMNGKLEK